MSKINLNEIIFFTIIVVCSILIPFLEFLNSNISILDYVLNKSLVFLFSSVSLFLLIFSLVVYLFIKKKISYRNVFLIVLTFYVFFPIGLERKLAGRVPSPPSYATYDASKKESNPDLLVNEYIENIDYFILPAFYWFSKQIYGF